ncbi:hypothetical protein [Nocardia bovistercoris]|uniref:Uncharacterized protein n=1 Tax=Nocardia bovistercoris TaxID=2785916 RepID=A0A931N290_9NOCA|nr:hypothetical protein [Nocardia bovistercoris]MBH0776497.1 hypothetical protein [Nocardia bovistercoris]
MLGIHWAELAETPEGVRDAVEMVAAFDAALVDGVGRLGDAGTAALSALAGAVAGSPLGAPVADAVARVAAGAIGPEALGALAGARAAVLGAVHDALALRFDTALGRVRAEWAGPDPSQGASTLAAGCRAWLQELAITGWRGVDHELVAAADRTVEALWDQPELRRLAVLLDGFAAELHAASPIASLDRVPARRWADLWSRALLLTWRAESPPAPETVSGRLLILGVDVHEHGTAVQAQVHALLEVGAGPARRVRVSVSAAKVDTIVGPAVWQVLGEHPRLLQALAEHRVLTIADTAITPSGDLLWCDANATLGTEADPFTTARVRLADAVSPAVAPLDRDPVHLAEPVLLEGYRIVDGVLELDGGRVPIETDRLPDCGPLTPALVADSTACIGLLRWDVGGWSLRPLAIQRTVKGATVQVHNGDWAQGPTDAKIAKALAKSGDSVAVLRERAGRLLRK